MNKPPCQGLSFFFLRAHILSIENGRNLTLCKQPYVFSEMVKEGLPNSLRGEIWEVCSGSIFLRFANHGLYENLLETHKNEVSPSMDDIDKDLHR